MEENKNPQPENIEAWLEWKNLITPRKIEVFGVGEVYSKRHVIELIAELVKERPPEILQ